MKKVIFVLIVIAIVVISVVMMKDLNNPIIEGKQRGSVINLDYSTPVETVVRHEGRFVEVESGMVYSLPRLWRSEIENLEGKKIQILGTRHLKLPKAASWRINGEKIIGADVTGKGTAIRMITDYSTYTYIGTVLAVYGDTYSSVYRIYFPHRYVPEK